MSGGPDALNALLGQITTNDLQYNLQTDGVVKVRAMYEGLSRYSRFRLPSPGQHYFRLLGIGTDPDPPGSHSHPVSKTLEDYCLREIVPARLRLLGPFATWFLKRFKHDRLLRDLHLEPKDPAYPLLNFGLVEKDVLRYDEITELPPPDVEQQTLFVHDALHHFSPADVLMIFSKSPYLTTLVGTVDYPVPLLLDVPSFECPAYSYRIVPEDKEMFEFAPDGVWSESYVQPVSGSWLLKTSAIHGDGLDLGVSINWSADPCHLVVITRGLSVVKGHNTLQVPGCDLVRTAAGPRLLNRTALRFLLNYSFPVGHANHRSIAARLNMWCNDHKHEFVPASDRYLMSDVAYRERLRLESSLASGFLGSVQTPLGALPNLMLQAAFGPVLHLLPSHPDPGRGVGPATWTSPRQAEYRHGAYRLGPLWDPVRRFDKRDLPSAIESIIWPDKVDWKLVAVLPPALGSGSPRRLSDEAPRPILLGLFFLLLIIGVLLQGERVILRNIPTLVAHVWSSWPAALLRNRPLLLPVLNSVDYHLAAFLPLLWRGLFRPMVYRADEALEEAIARALLRLKAWLIPRFPVLIRVDLALHQLFSPNYMMIPATPVDPAANDSDDSDSDEGDSTDGDDDSTDYGDDDDDDSMDNGDDGDGDDSSHDDDPFRDDEPHPDDDTDSHHDSDAPPPSPPPLEAGRTKARPPEKPASESPLSQSQADQNQADQSQPGQRRSGQSPVSKDTGSCGSWSKRCWRACSQHQH